MITMIFFLQKELNLLIAIDMKSMPEIAITKKKSDRGVVDHFIVYCRYVLLNLMGDLYSHDK